MLSYFLHYRKGAVEKAIDEAMVAQIVPGVRDLINQVAQQITKQPGFEDSPYAREVAAEFIIKELASFLAMSSMDDVDTARPSMLSDEFSRWWFSVEDTAEQGGSK